MTSFFLLETKANDYQISFFGMFWENSPIHGLNIEASTNFRFSYFIDQFCFWESKETQKIQTIQEEFCNAVSVKNSSKFLAVVKLLLSS